MSSEADLKAFIDRQRVLLSKERDAEIERSTLLLSNCGPKLLEQKGLALGGLGVAGISIGLGGKTLIELERPTAYHSTPIFPPHSFRNGDIARIEANVTATNTKRAKPGSTADTKSAPQAEGVVYRVTDTRIVIAVDASDSSSDDLDLPERCRLLKIANSVTYDRMDKTIDHLERTVIQQEDGKSSAGPNALVRVLMGISPRSPPEKLGPIPYFDQTLNDSQKAAIRFCLEAQEVACIHGPPGTGKTHTLIEIIRQLATGTSINPNPKRILVCGASNLSVDNILERLLALPVTEKKDRLRVTRIGHPARVMAHEGILDSTLEVKATRSDEAALARDVKTELEETLATLSGKGKGAKGKGPRGAERRKMWDDVKALRKEYRQREGGVVKSVLKDSQIVLATCHSSGGRQLYNQDFDVVIIDEATQALEAVCWIPIFKGKKLILAGDPMQLPPTIISLDAVRKKKEKKSASKPTSNKDSKATKKSTPVKPQVKPAQDAESQASDGESDGSSEELTEAASSMTISSSPARAKLQPPRTLETTLFDRLERMYGASIKRMLEVQYRMHDLICDFPSKTLYGGKLRSHDSVASHLLSDLPNTNAETEEDEKEILQTPVVFFDTSGCEYFERLDGDGDEGSRCNENEGTIVSQWIDKLVEAGLDPSQIVVITPYQAQVTLLTSLLRPKHGPTLEIGTVDGMQGREKEAVIISLVRSNDTREVGFLKEKRRMNVAMTRARRHLESVLCIYGQDFSYSSQCIVGDSSTIIHGGSYLKKWLAWLEANADVKYAGLD